MRKQLKLYKGKRVRLDLTSGVFFRGVILKVSFTNVQIYTVDSEGYIGTCYLRVSDISAISHWHNPLDESQDIESVAFADK